MSERAPRINPDTGEVEMVDVDPATGAIIGTFTGARIADERPAVEPLPPLTAAEQADDAEWDPYRSAPPP